VIDAVILAAQNFCHWIITVTYIKVAFEAKMLIKKETYIQSAAELLQADRFRFRFTIANIVASVLILLFSAFCCFTNVF
jgi:hypothetical protein